MRIVISTDLYHPMINGVAVFSRNLAVGLTQRGHQVIVLAPSITGDFAIEKDPDHHFKIVRLSSVKLPFYPDQINKVTEMKAIFGKKIPRLFYKKGLNVSFNPYFEIKRVLDDFQPDLIHDQTPGPVALAVFYYAKKRGIPLVSTGHAYPDNLTSQLGLPKTIKKPVDAVVRSYLASFLKKSAHATAPTEVAVHDLVPNRHKISTPVEALSNGIDLSRFSPRKPKSTIYAQYNLPKTPFALYVGRIDPEKSLHILIEAFAQVLTKLPTAKLVIVGDGTKKQYLQQLSKQLKIADSVIFTGKIIGNDLPEVYRAARLFAITSTTETQSIVLMEAMASGLPAVAVRAGAIPELVKNNLNGFLCKPDDVAAISRSITKIFNHDDLQAQMSKASLEIISTHDIDYTLARIEQIYTKVISKTA